MADKLTEITHEEQYRNNLEQLANYPSGQSSLVLSTLNGDGSEKDDVLIINKMSH